MQLNTVEELLEDIRQGKMVILMDDEDRENEGDLVIAAEKVRAEDINFMAKYARGLICLTLTGERCQQLNLPLMVDNNQAQYSTNFTMSIEAAEGVTTGISAADRALTVQAAVARDARAEDIVQPGHIFPLKAQPGGVLSRAGHTEAGCDMARMAGYEAASVIVEIMNEDGTMARRPDLEVFAKEHDLKIGTIADLIEYRAMNESTVERKGTHKVETEFGEFDLVSYYDNIQDCTHVALVKGDIVPEEPVVVRVHLADTMRDLLSIRKPGGSSSWSLHKALERVAAEGKGVVVLLSDNSPQEDLQDKLEHYLGLSRPNRSIKQDGTGAYLTIGTGSQILRDLNVRKMRLLSSPLKFSAISGFNLEITETICCE